MSAVIIVVGLGEIGKPLFELIHERYRAIGVDLSPVEVHEPCDVMHICYPFEIEGFIGKSVAYIHQYQPKLTIINSTVSPGTTRAVFEAAKLPVVHSPIRGKHARMEQDLLHYVKFIGGIHRAHSEIAASHFESLQMKTHIMSTPETTELAKLSATTYFALQVAWAQEMERYCRQLSLEYDEVITFYEEIGYLPPVRYFPGVIGGHCLMPNIKILKTRFESRILDAIIHSNQLKASSQEMEDESEGRP